VAGMCIMILYRLLILRDKSTGKLTDEVHELAKIVSGNSAIINLCCVHGVGRAKGGE
jgi:hypothetical protein